MRAALDAQALAAVTTFALDQMRVAHVPLCLTCCLRGSYDARQEALQAHLFGARFTKVAPFAAPAAHSVAAELYEHQAARHVQPSEESRLVLKARPGTSRSFRSCILWRLCWLTELVAYPGEYQ